MSARAAYDDVVVVCPTTLPYVRYSIHGAHWFLAGALAELLKRAGLAKDRVDGLCVSSFTLFMSCSATSNSAAFERCDTSPVWIIIAGFIGSLAMRWRP